MFIHSFLPFLHARKRVLNRGKRKCKGPEARKHLLCSKNSKGWGEERENGGR